MLYVSQTAKGELVIGSELDPYQTYCTRSTLPTLEQMATYTLELFPQLHGVNILRQWAGVCDMTPDYAPIMGASRTELDNFFMDVGWGTWGFKAGPIAWLKRLAETIATGKAAVLMEPFAPTRFTSGKLLGEKSRRLGLAVGMEKQNLTNDLKALIQEKGIEYFLCSLRRNGWHPQSQARSPPALWTTWSLDGAGCRRLCCRRRWPGPPYDPDLVSVPDVCRP